MEKIIEWTEQNLEFAQKLTGGVSLGVTMLINLISDEGLRGCCAVLWCICVMVMTIFVAYVSAFKE